MKLQSLALVLLCGASVGHGMSTNDLAKCRYANGNSIEPKVCESLRAAAAREKDEAASRDARLVKIREAEVQRQADAAELDGKRPAAVAEAERRSAEQHAARAKVAQQAQQSQAEAEAAEEARLEILRKQCGSDFGRPAVGMSLERARQCVADLELFGQNGPVSHYRSGRLHITVQAGRITRWVAL